MIPAGVIRGVVGQIKWSYYNAAAVNGYTVTRTKIPSGGASWRLRATVIQVDKYKMAQRPLVFAAPHEKGIWRWPIEQFNLQGGELSAQLGPPLR